MDRATHSSSALPIPVGLRKAKGLQGAKMAALEYPSVCAFQYWNGGTLLRVRKFEPSVTNLRLAGLNRKRPGVKRPPIVCHQPPVSRNLEQQGLAAHERAGAVGHVIDQVHSAGLVDGHFP